MRTAPEELDHLTNSTDWPTLVDMALDDPPNPNQLYAVLFSWNTNFQVVHSRKADWGDFPQPVSWFFTRLAYADYPPELFEWITAFEKKEGRKPSTADIPERLRQLIPKNKGGRPRCDTRRWLAARRAWLVMSLGHSYKMRRDTIAHIGKHLKNCFGYTSVDICGDRPSTLALAKLSEEVGISPERIQDLLGHRKH
jgi:hypothetical protein